MDKHNGLSIVMRKATGRGTEYRRLKAFVYRVVGIFPALSTRRHKARKGYDERRSLGLE